MRTFRIKCLDSPWYWQQAGMKWILSCSFNKLAQPAQYTDFCTRDRADACPRRSVFPWPPVPQRGELNAVLRCATLSTGLKKYSWIYTGTMKFVQYRLYFFKFIDKHISTLIQRATLFLKYLFFLKKKNQSKTKVIARFVKSVTQT